MPELEDSQYWQRNFERNKTWLKAGNHVYNTPLNPQQERQFRQWLQQNQVAFNPSLAVSDYDMRGFWAALQRGDPMAESAINPNDQRMHFPDYWKTPYNATFSNQSQWANPQTAPQWTGDVYHLPNGTVLWNDKLQQWTGPDAPWSASPGAMAKVQQQNVDTVKAMRGSGLP